MAAGVRTLQTARLLAEETTSKTFICSIYQAKPLADIQFKPHRCFLQFLPQLSCILLLVILMWLINMQTTWHLKSSDNAHSHLLIIQRLVFHSLSSAAVAVCHCVSPRWAQTWWEFNLAREWKKKPQKTATFGPSCDLFFPSKQAADPAAI